MSNIQGTLRYFVVWNRTECLFNISENPVNYLLVNTLFHCWDYWSRYFECFDCCWRSFRILEIVCLINIFGSLLASKANRVRFFIIEFSTVVAIGFRRQIKISLYFFNTKFQNTNGSDFTTGFVKYIEFFTFVLIFYTSIKIKVYIYFATLKYVVYSSKLSSTNNLLEYCCNSSSLMTILDQHPGLHLEYLISTLNSFRNTSKFYRRVHVNSLSKVYGLFGKDKISTDQLSTDNYWNTKKIVYLISVFW